MAPGTERREFLLQSSALVASATISLTVLSARGHAAGHSELTDLSATAAVAAMRNGDTSAEQYARALLDRAQTVADLNAFRTLDREMVLEAARAADKRRASGAVLGLLHGLPVPVKDSVNTKALPTSSGTRVLRDFQPKDDAPVLKALFAQGAILMGKTNMHEISRGWTCNNGAFGAVHNPYDESRIPGGSSGGSAAAVAARIAPLAIAEDTIGSIRVPSTMCGVTGLRPTYGRYPNAGIMPLSINKFDQVGPLSRSVVDLALFDAVVSGNTGPLQPGSLHGVRFGISEFLLTGLDPEVERITREALTKLQAAGATLVWAEIPEVTRDALWTAIPIVLYEHVASISAYLDEHGTGVSFDELLATLSPNIQVLYKTSPVVSREAYEAALRRREQIRLAIGQYFHAQAITALVFPPALTPAPPLGDNFEIEIRGEKTPIRTVMGRNTALGSVASMASLILPAGMTARGLPVGIEFDALPGNDRALLSLGLSLEAALGPIRAPVLQVSLATFGP